ncbi:5-methyltetrahydropteroyltriglutamate--homocysteine S-methyltransferase [Salicibibacter halophilus]|uniref:5-methyltetrahydropteroyltriglutamate--homocysteine S-methyltransferase n=1 Tax=Salicibibacter halophilus TaxID=2502791 RepID=A0A514LKK6_9BACI|nr:5-methyltetrahydropteroyltriglutamate--homocysteine S-methyltransferase [Salicibibacter halophilus]QDI92362.1 5-methyltetrahydropteroyltriglutamate--homocysteine S-methyltransferase [Salicibibacter halophilus]
MSISLTHAPYRADHVGSILRTERLKKAREDRSTGAITAEQLREVEDEEIRAIVEKQKEAGLTAITDGEFRRAWWHLDFLEGFDGVEGYEPEHGYKFRGVETKAWLVRINGELDFPDNHPFLEHFRHLKSLVGEDYVAKQTIPSPSMLYADEHFVPGVYDDRSQFRKDLAAAYKKAVHAFYDAGCRYLQLDDVGWAHILPTEDDTEEQREEKHNKQQWFKEIINEALSDRPDDLTVTMHICRGNFRSTWIRTGSYDPVAKTVFQEVGVDGLFLEYDDERSGTFEALQYVNRTDLKIVLGIVTSKTGKLEDKEALKSRIQEAEKYVPLEQLALSPQCGFASTEEGNILSEEAQWAKLRHVKEVADEVWGES